MHLDHDTAACVVQLVDLVNRDDRRSGADLLVSAEQLVDYLDSHEISGERAGTGRELAAVRRLRTRLRTIFDDATHGDLDQVVVAINRLLAEAGAVPQLVEHDGAPLHLHYTPSDAPLHHRLAAEMALALGVVLRDGGLERIRVCESPDCGRVLVDVTRNRSRRYCDTQCGNRQHVATYRARHTQPS